MIEESVERLVVGVGEMKRAAGGGEIVEGEEGRVEASGEVARVV